MSTGCDLLCNLDSAALFSSLDSLREEFLFLPFECYLLLELLACTLVY